MSPLAGCGGQRPSSATSTPPAHPERPAIAGPPRAAVVELNGDAFPDSVVLLATAAPPREGGDTLLIFQGTDHGQRLLCRVGSVRAPVHLSPGRVRGWNDLVVGTVDRDGTAKNVVLHFDGFAYPPNAARMPAMRAAPAAGARELIAQ